MPERQPNVAIISVIVIILLAAATVGTIMLTNKSKDSESQKPGTSDVSDTPPVSTESGTTASDGMYKDGTYTETGTYATPGGQENVTVTVTLAQGVITATSVEGSGGSSNAVEYQGKFIGGYKDLVVGKKIDDVSLSRVSGSSLTSQGFNNALDAIRKDAQSS
jgi:uncharacterized protein with FMN-binding domain